MDTCEECGAQIEDEDADGLCDECKEDANNG